MSNDEEYVEPPLTRRERLRRVVLLCADFTRNLAYYRTSFRRSGVWKRRSQDFSFWMTVQSNALDMCVLDWCKLFGKRNDQHAWQEVVSDSAAFESNLLKGLGVSVGEFDKFRDAMFGYRDKFVAHLDSLRKISIPEIELAQDSVNFYCAYVAEHEAEVGDLQGLPDSALKLKLGYEQSEREAEAVYSQLL